jgi:alpha-maltose-1-phosphate synthase
MTSHSLEPLRPWKAEQLGGGYALSSYCEATAICAADAVIAVSRGMRADILRCYPAIDPDRVHVIHNGIDPDEYSPRPDPDLRARHGIPADRPLVIFVGRITRQKGVVHLLEAARHLDPDAVLVLCAGEPDTPAIAAEFRTLVDEVRGQGRDLVWLETMLPRAEVVSLLSMSDVFVCPSVYEPFGIVNLEAMACGLPVVATRVGGIPEIVVEGETGHLVEVDADPTDPTGEPRDRDAFARRLAGPINQLLGNRDRARQIGAAGRKRAAAEFSWTAVARRTAELYRELSGSRARR